MWRAGFALLAACTTAPLDTAFESAARLPNLTSLSVRQDGALVREQFYAGTDAGTAHDVRSVTKTVMALVVGTALDAGCLTSLDQTLGASLGDQAPAQPATAAITLRDLLTMTSGLAWTEDGALGFNAWAEAPNQVSYVLAQPVVDPPGTVFNYNSGALHLLSAIVTRACGPTAAFAATHLFAPLGIAARDWETDNQGITNGAAGLQLATSEMAALGQLILDGGMREDVQVVSPAYVAMATSAQIATGDTADETPSYGFGAWIGDDPHAGSFTLAEGFGGQFIVVVPGSRAVIVATTNWQGLGAVADRDYNDLYELITTRVLPAL